MTRENHPKLNSESRTIYFNNHCSVVYKMSLTFQQRYDKSFKRLNI